MTVGQTIRWTVGALNVAVFVALIVLIARARLGGSRPQAVADHSASPATTDDPSRASGSSSGGRRPPPVRLDECQLETARLREEIARLGGSTARHTRPIDVFASAPSNPALTAAVTQQVERFVGARASELGNATVECRGDACKIDGLNRNAWFPLRRDPWFAERLLGANPGDQLYLRLAPVSGRPVGDVLDELVRDVVVRADQVCPGRAGKKVEFLFTLRDEVEGERPILTIEQPAFGARENCLVEFAMRLAEGMNLTGVVGDKAGRVVRL
jgi:hypothetical protein